MFFHLTKLVGALLMPVSVVLLLLLAGLISLRFERTRRSALVALWLGTGLLLLVSLPAVADPLLGSLEDDYPVLADPPPANWIVVLGGGSRGPAAWPPVVRLSPSSLYRLAEGVRLASRLPGARLVTSGGKSDGGETTAELMARVALGWGVDSARIVTLGPLNTDGEAVAVARLVPPGEIVILVTSAFHMRRAVALFETVGVEVVPAPTGYFAAPPGGRVYPADVLPSGGAVELAERAWWEHLGLAWASVRGRSS